MATYWHTPCTQTQHWRRSSAFYTKNFGHKAHELIVPSNMTLVPLPPYSPDLNPAEHVWDYIRENDMQNEVFPDLDKVMDAVETSLHRLHDQPHILQSMTAFPWIMEAVA